MGARLPRIGRQDGAAFCGQYAMSSDLLVTPVAAAPSGSEATGPPRTNAGGPSTQPRQSTVTVPNPSLQLDPELGLVVIQFRNDAGEVTTSVPSERQIQAYQRWQTTHFGPAPQGLPVATTPSPSGHTPKEVTSTIAERPAIARGRKVVTRD
jgi:hypothetical protein